MRLQGKTAIVTGGTTGIGRASSVLFPKEAARAVLLARALAVDYARKTIRVNALCPGVVDTPMLRWAASQETDPAAAWERYSADQPLGRLATPEECAYVALWLVSDEASFITGVA